ncbi:MAG: YebC/PmpR family DNA-binding transcriptional regulator [Bacteroidetes bacterium]|jgi:YebC/PmpR family DNA-binding regulatory protein|nr:YebC/PmpR family DNA-binding transcriptional regulator [Bacteroidota bacterium]MBT6687774.1 YebC/PmpR family DNA-binding transcriptional regulator [Bacteroidota bacterium]MBT7143408.1 YebC/PmpR family DNA-binding transcriptional regulator [Bacteroidota bacterium]MBT7492542.1 YebC/PmpR family DNA-binding transcriptional regulator [Bacteroidota bacterium]
MSGHSKWSTIKRKKGAADAKRSKMFSRIVKEITIAVKEGGGSDEDSNPRLRMAIQNAKGVNMPKDNISRAISKANKDESNFQEITFEGYAPHGIAIYVECLTDNNNRTISNIRAIFTKKGGSLGTNGSLSFLFDRKGVFNIPKGELDPDEFELEIIDAGVEDFEFDGDNFIITTALEDFGNVQKKLDEMKIVPENAELQRIPNDAKSLDIQDAKKILAMVETFEEDDDVQNVFHNLEITDELLEEL